MTDITMEELLVPEPVQVKKPIPADAVDRLWVRCRKANGDAEGMTPDMRRGNRIAWVGAGLMACSLVALGVAGYMPAVRQCCTWTGCNCSCWWVFAWVYRGDEKRGLQGDDGALFQGSGHEHAGTDGAGQSKNRSGYGILRRCQFSGSRKKGGC